jgi:hypothetical protein
MCTQWDYSRNSTPVCSVVEYAPIVAALLQLSIDNATRERTKRKSKIDKFVLHVYFMYEKSSMKCCELEPVMEVLKQFGAHR